jgi:hypothetical protein
MDKVKKVVTVPLVAPPLWKGKVENRETVNDHYWGTKLGVGWFLARPNMVNFKSGGSKRMQWQADVVIGWISHVSPKVTL